MQNVEGRIRGFDGLRAIAFLLVFISHKTAIRNNEHYGDIGVWLFFVLSGFLITRILARTRAAIDGGQIRFSDGLSRFYLRRTARIFPVYYLLLAFFTVVALFTSRDHFGPIERLAYWLYATNVLVEVRHAWVGDFGHFWSLAIEEQFYLLFAPMVLLLPRAHTSKVAITFLVVGLVAKVALEIAGASPIAIDVDSLVNFTLLALGGLVGLAAQRPVPRFLVSTGAQVGLLAIYVALPMASGSDARFWAWFGKSSSLLAAAMLLQVFQNQEGLLVKILESKPVALLGRITYGAYLFHPFIHFRAAERLLRQFNLVLDWPRAFQLFVELAATLVLAALSWRFIERPVLDRAARLAMPKPERAAA
jgi:peptidoglycan/LPS O-acetylase OafA/YrhL